MKKIITPLLLIAVTALSSPAFSNNVKFELGYGLPTGHFGGNANFDVGNNVELFAGLGAAIGKANINNADKYAAAPAFSLGARYYVAPHIRLLVGYGTIGGMLTKDASWATNLDIETIKGRYLGVGYMTSRNKGLVADIMYVDTSKFDEKITEIEERAFVQDSDNDTIKFSVGYRF